MGAEIGSISVTNGRALGSSSMMPQSVPQPITTSPQRARTAGGSEHLRRIDAPSVLIVAAAMLTAPVVMWLIDLLVTASS